MDIIIHVVDVTDWADFERPDMAKRFEVVAAPYGETIVAHFATAAEAIESAMSIKALNDDYLTSWGMAHVNTDVTVYEYVTTTLAPIVSPVTREPIPAHRLGATTQEWLGYADVIAIAPRVPGQLWERMAEAQINADLSIIASVVKRRNAAIAAGTFPDHAERVTMRGAGHPAASCANAAQHLSGVIRAGVRVK